MDDSNWTSPYMHIPNAFPRVLFNAEGDWQLITYNQYNQLRALARELALVVEYIENFGDPDPYIMRGLTDRARKLGLLE